MPKQRIFIAAGHGGTDPGSTGQGTTEREECIRLVNLVVAKLRADKRFEVFVVPHSLGLSSSIKWVNARVRTADDGLSMEIHKNCCNAKGTETWYPTPSAVSTSIARTFQAAFASYMGTPNRGAKADHTNRHGRLGWCRDVITRSILVEAGFITGEPLNTAKHAEGIFRATLAVWGLKPKAPPKPVPPKPTVPTAVTKYRVDHVLTDDETFKTVAGGKFINLLTNKTIKTYKQNENFTTYSTFLVGSERYYTTKYSHDKTMKSSYLAGIKKSDLVQLDNTPPAPPPVDDYEDPKEEEVPGWFKDFIKKLIEFLTFWNKGE